MEARHTALTFGKRFEETTETTRKYGADQNLKCTMYGYRNYTADYFAWDAQKSDADFKRIHAEQGNHWDTSDVSRIKVAGQISRAVTEKGTEVRKRCTQR